MSTNYDVDELLEAALNMTERLARGPIDEASVKHLLTMRAPLLTRACAARDDWTMHNHRAAQRLQEADRRIVAALWHGRADAFAWLLQRKPELRAQLPNLTALAS